MSLESVYAGDNIDTDCRGATLRKFVSGLAECSKPRKGTAGTTCSQRGRSVLVEVDAAATVTRICSTISIERDGERKKE